MSWQLVLTIFLGFSPAVFAEGDPSSGAVSVLVMPRESDYGVGSWIWAAETRDQQTCSFWKTVEVSGEVPVARAIFRITADNSFRFYFDGREIGQGAEWKSLTEYDLTLLFTPGIHVLAVEAFNDYNQAGVVAGLHMEFQDGRAVFMPTDASWKVVTTDNKHWDTMRHADPRWLPATVVAPYHGGIWKISTPSRIVLVPPIQPITLKFWQSGWFHVLSLTVLIILTITCFRLMGKLAIQSHARQIMQRERARIARDIHDDLTANLTQLVLLGEVAKSSLPDNSESCQQVTKLCDKARSVSTSMNEIIWVVNSQRDTFRDFTSYVCKYAETFLQSTSIRCRFDIDEEMPDLPCDLGVRRNLFLGVKEALNNAVRHSGASELILRIHRQEDRIVVTVEDNGNGFDPDGADRHRNGLANMMQRATEAGGVCRITSKTGDGCCVEFSTSLARTKPYKGFWKSGLWSKLRTSTLKPVS